MALLFNTIPLPQTPDGSIFYPVAVFWWNEGKKAFVAFMEANTDVGDDSFGYFFTVDFNGSNPVLSNTQQGGEPIGGGPSFYQLSFGQCPAMQRQKNTGTLYGNYIVDASGTIWSNTSDFLFEWYDSSNVLATFQATGSAFSVFIWTAQHAAGVTGTPYTYYSSWNANANSYVAGGVNYVGGMKSLYSSNQLTAPLHAQWSLGVVNAGGRSTIGDFPELFEDELTGIITPNFPMTGFSDPIFDNKRYMFISQWVRAQSAGWNLYKFDVTGGSANLVATYVYPSSIGYGGLYDAYLNRLIMFNYAGGYEIIDPVTGDSQGPSAVIPFAPPLEALRLSNPSLTYAISPEYCLAAQKWLTDTTNGFFFGLDATVTFVGNVGYAGLRRHRLTDLTWIDTHYPAQEWLTGNTNPTATDFDWNANSFAAVPALNALLWGPTNSDSNFYELFWPAFNSNPGGGGPGGGPGTPPTGGGGGGEPPPLPPGGNPSVTGCENNDGSGHPL